MGEENSILNAFLAMSEYLGDSSGISFDHEYLADAAKNFMQYASEVVEDEDEKERSENLRDSAPVALHKPKLRMFNE